jgi:hypothetical protein
MHRDTSFSIGAIEMTHRRTTVLAILAACALAAPTVAQRQPTTAPVAEAAQPELILRTYDIGDLVRPTQNYPIAPTKKGEGEGSGGLFADGTASPSEPPAKLSAEFVGQMLIDLVASDSWKVNGGTLGSLQPLPTQTALLVQQTEANHKLIAATLAEIREQQGVRTMVSTRAEWVLLDAADVRAIFDRARAVAPQGATLGPPIVDDATMAKARSYARGQTTSFNGQTVSITSGREWSVVTDMTPVVGTGAVGYAASIARAASGVTLQLTPQLMPDRESVVLDLRSTVTETRPPQGAGIDLAPIAAASSSSEMATTRPAVAGANALIDRQDVVRQSFATTVRLPLGKRVLVSGMTLEPTVAGEPKSQRQLYLVVEVDSMK